MGEPWEDGCGDSLCIIKKPSGGLVTNGGCRCRPWKFQRLIKAQNDRITELENPWVEIDYTSADCWPDEGQRVVIEDDEGYADTATFDEGDKVLWKGWNIVRWMPIPSVSGNNNG